MLGYSSAFGMCCMLLFTFTVVLKHFSIPCPLVAESVVENATSLVGSVVSGALNSTLAGEDEQYCEPKMFEANSRVSFPVRILF